MADEQNLREPTYFEIVWGQFKKNKIAYTAMWLFLGLFVVAVIAPVISSNQPFRVEYELWSDAAGSCTDRTCIETCEALVAEGGETCTVETIVEHPWFTGLLFNSNVYGQGVDVFFNLLLVLLPFILGGYLVYRRFLMKWQPDRIRNRRRSLFIRAAVGLIFVSLLVVLKVQPQTAVPRWQRAVTEVTIDAETYPVVSYPREGGSDLIVVRSAMFPYRPFSYSEPDGMATNQRSGPEHILGTDNAGRDLFVRMVYGSRLSLTIGVIAVGIYVFIGVFLGALAGFHGKWVDIVIQRMIEVMMAFPTFILILTFVSILPSRSVFYIMIIIGVTRWPTVARLVRGEFLRLKQVDFVQAAIASGLHTRHIIFRHVLPNAMGPVLVAATFGIADAILIEAALSFLGVSDLDTASWGRILSVGRSQHDFFTMLLPGMAIFFTVTVLNLIGEGLRDALDPKLRR